MGTAIGRTTQYTHRPKRRREIKKKKLDAGEEK
jgi:hypothetical protein